MCHGASMGGGARLPTVAARAVLSACLAVAVAACSDEGGGGSPAGSPPTGAEDAATTTVPPCGESGRTYEVDGIRVHEFCGPAQALVRLGTPVPIESNAPAQPLPENGGDAAPAEPAGEPTEVRFHGGTCRRTPEALELHLGHEVIERGAGDEVLRPRFSSFTLLLGRHELAPDDAVPAPGDGRYQRGVITFAVPGTSYLVENQTTTLVASRRAGAFEGDGFAGASRMERVPVQGYFTCDPWSIPLDTVPERVETPGLPDEGEGEQGEETDGR